MNNVGLTYAHKKFTFNYVEYNVSFDYYISHIYETIGQNVLRVLSFNVLDESPIQLNVEINMKRSEVKNDCFIFIGGVKFIFIILFLRS